MCTAKICFLTSKMKVSVPLGKCIGVRFYDLKYFTHKMHLGYKKMQNFSKNLSGGFLSKKFNDK
jgi:hypothetical protein